MYNAKQVIVMRRDLKMRKGKIAAQAGHASSEAVLRAIMKAGIFDQLRETEDGYVYVESDEHTPLIDWFNKGVAKICVYVDSEEALLELKKHGEDKGYIVALIQDAGYTEFHGEATYTCLAYEPLYKEDIDEITGELPLY